MRKVLAVLAMCASSLLAQSVETYPYLVFMSPANETPPIADNSSSAVGTVLVHVVRDSGGAITSATADLGISYKLNAATNFTGFHIHRGAAGVAGPVLLNTGISASAPVAGALSGSFMRPVQVPSTDTTNLDTVRGILNNPADYYLNIHTTEFPGGLMRGQLLAATPLVLLTRMEPGQEVPPVTNSTGTALTTISALAAISGGKYLGGQVTFDVNYTGFTAGTAFTGLHVHKAPAGVNGAITIPTAVSAANPVTVPDSGSGNIRMTVDMVPDATGSNTAIKDLYEQPTGHYANVHTAQNPGGVARGQLRTTDRSTFQVMLSPANEVPPITGLAATAPSQVILYTSRGSDGNAELANLIYDVNPRFPGDTTFTGLHIHSGAAGANGPVILDSGLSGTNNVPITGGAGNIFRQFTVTTTAGLQAVNGALANPDGFYLNLHTTVNPGGAVRSQLAAVNTAMPTVSSIRTATGAQATTNIAPGGLAVIRGTNLTKVNGDSSGTGGGMLPMALNGTSVTIGGKAAPIFAVMGDMIVVQVPNDVAVGTGANATVPVIVTSANGASTAVNATIATLAPSLFVNSSGAAIALKNSDYSLITNDNSVKSGDIVVLYGTGFGGVTPSVATGQVAPSAAPFASTQTVTVTVGGQTAEVFYSILAPGFAGLNQIAFRVPTGVATGTQPVVATVGGVSSNSVTISVRN